MKSLHQHIEERLIINKNYKATTEDLVEQAIDNNVETVENDIIMFPDVKSFLSCLDELDIEYTTDENKKYDNGDILWIEFKHEFKYSSLPTSATLMCKYARISKPYYDIDGIIIRFGTISKSTWAIMQGLLAGGHICIKKYAAEQLKNLLIALVDNKNN